MVEGDDIKENIDKLFLDKVTPGFMERVASSLQKDPLFKASEKCRLLSQGIDTMLEATITMNSQVTSTELPLLKERFRDDISKLSTLIREGENNAALQRLSDVLTDFESYKSATLNLYARITNVLQSFPNYSNELMQISSDLNGIRAFIMDEKYVVLSADDLRNLAKIVIEIISKANEVGDEVEHDKSVAELVEEKETVKDKIPVRGV